MSLEWSSFLHPQSHIFCSQMFCQQRHCILIYFKEQQQTRILKVYTDINISVFEVHEMVTIIRLLFICFAAGLLIFSSLYICCIPLNFSCSPLSLPIGNTVVLCISLVMAWIIEYLTGS